MNRPEQPSRELEDTVPKAARLTTRREDEFESC
jgi:hypothetical protein